MLVGWADDWSGRMTDPICYYIHAAVYSLHACYSLLYYIAIIVNTSFILEASLHHVYMSDNLVSLPEPYRGW